MWSVSGLLALSAVEGPPVILWSTTKWLLFQWRTQGKGCSVISLLSATFTPKVRKPMASAPAAMLWRSLPLLVVALSARSFSNATGRPWYLATMRKQVGPQSMWSGCW